MYDGHSHVDLLSMVSRIVAKSGRVAWAACDWDVAHDGRINRGVTHSGDVVIISLAGRGQAARGPCRSRSRGSRQAEHDNRAISPYGARHAKRNDRRQV